MGKVFNVTGACNLKKYYMVDIAERLEAIKHMVDAGEYFTINRARQFGKTTTLLALRDYLKEDYIVISLDFQKMSNAAFENEGTFSKTFADYIIKTIKNRRNPLTGLNLSILEDMGKKLTAESSCDLRLVFDWLMDLCDTAEKPVVLLIDEVDSAADNQVFLDFLAQLREMIYALLFQGREISYSSMNTMIDIAVMFGFVSIQNYKVVIANRIFETVLYTLFLSEEQLQSRMYDSALIDRNQFVRGEKQLLEYMQYYHLEKGYMISFNFNKNKETGVKEIYINGKKLIEAVI